MENETIVISIAAAEKLGISWSDICDVTNYNRYAVNEGMSKDEKVYIPVSLIKRA